MTTTIETITTHQLREGDVILNHGMRLRVDGEPRVSKAHPVDTDDPSRGHTVYYPALIENWDALVEASETDKWIAGFIVGLVRSDLREGRITEPRWTIQGNGWARWAREVQA
ncbi:hypothetical protein SEA_RACHALY_85 [Mycobacterium Phage Rachaly]|nr:hypothetical protein SEA_RACHALY_85 [Mycobacterium Phage Rachaly]QGH78778.1 hypothetical protein SEA_MIKO_84 [Mycobacterium phage Miko]